jgi:hypothetical protein
MGANSVYGDTSSVGISSTGIFALQGTKELPTGWSRSEFERKTGGPLGRREIKSYKHESDPTTLFEHPIPLC